jgi:hypothetical protein
MIIYHSSDNQAKISLLILKRWEKKIEDYYAIFCVCIDNTQSFRTFRKALRDDS